MAAADDLLDAPPPTPGPWRRLLGNRTAVAAMLVLAALVILAISASYLTNAQPLRISPGIRLRPPSARNWFGTDHLGRDMFALVLFGGRTTLLVGVLVTGLSVSVAVLLGLLSGFYRRVDLVLMRIVDGLMAFPSIVLATAAAGYLGPSVLTVIIALSIVLVAPVVRVVRGQILVLRELPMVEAAHAVGVPDRLILTRYMLPAVVSPLLVQASFIFSAAVLGEAALSFIGLGVGAADVSWGSALSEARNYIQNGWWIVVFPGAALVLTILALNLLGDALRDSLDPRLARR